MPLPAFSQEYKLFFSPLTVVDFNSQDIKLKLKLKLANILGVTIVASTTSWLELLKTAILPLNNRFWVDAG